jgi:hypothetical protein
MIAATSQIDDAKDVTDGIDPCLGLRQWTYDSNCRKEPIQLLSTAGLSCVLHSAADALKNARE